MPRFLRRKRTYLIGVPVLVLLVVVVAPFVYIHFIEGPAPAPLSLSRESTTTTAVGAKATTASPAASSTVDGISKVTNGSQVGYRIQETLFGQSNTAVGRTTAITGNLTISGTTVTAAKFSVDLTKVSSDQTQRDDQFQGRIMNTAQYPTATFTLTQPIQLATLPTDGVTITTKATGNLTMHGVTRSVSFQITARRSGTTIETSGSIPITFADWNISNPSGGPATTADHGILEFLINFVHT
jgi:polyisoprenoid-binding protein YceI